jgi:hypothetical protein
MATDPHGEKPPVDRGLGYEPRDANIKGLLEFAFWLAVLLAVTLVGMRWTFHYLSKVAPLGQTASPLVEPGQQQLPPNPRLQVHPHQELVEYCEYQQKMTSSYGWVNRETGVVRVPIDRAMDLILQKGLPARAANQAPPSAPTVEPPIVVAGVGLEGQCGYLTEPRLTAAGEGGESK